MKKLLFITVLTAFFAVNTFAQDKSSDVRKLIGLMQSDEMISGMLNSMTAAFSHGRSAELREFIVTETKAMLKRMEDEMVSIYSRHFTHEEVKDLIKFYESPLGRKFIEVTPALQNELMNAMMTKYMPEFQEKLMQKMDELDN